METEILGGMARVEPLILVARAVNVEPGGDGCRNTIGKAIDQGVDDGRFIGLEPVKKSRGDGYGRTGLTTGPAAVRPSGDRLKVEQLS
jgi:hypothetical protein